jgi:hypothetical protein
VKDWLTNTAAWLVPATAILLFFDKLGPGLSAIRRIWQRNQQELVWERVLRAITWVTGHSNHIAQGQSRHGWDPWFNEAERLGYLKHRKHGGGEYIYELTEKAVPHWGKQLDAAIEECDPRLVTWELRYFGLRPLPKHP